MEISDIIYQVQGALHLDQDRKAGPATWAAIYASIIGSRVADQPAPVVTGGTVDARSEANIATLHPKVQPYARSLVQKAAAAGITIKVISGLRTYAVQNDLYAQGRSKPGSKVTNAPAGYSNHNFGLAFDIGVWQGEKYLDDSPLYKAVAALGMDLGLEWGGSWKTIQDQPHYELRPSWAKDMPEAAMLTELRRRKADGRDYLS